MTDNLREKIDREQGQRQDEQDERGDEQEVREVEQEARQVEQDERDADMDARLQEHLRRAHTATEIARLAIESITKELRFPAEGMGNRPNLAEELRKARDDIGAGGSSHHDT